MVSTDACSESSDLRTPEYTLDSRIFDPALTDRIFVSLKTIERLEVIDTLHDQSPRYFSEAFFGRKASFAFETCIM